MVKVVGNGEVVWSRGAAGEPPVPAGDASLGAICDLAIRMGRSDRRRPERPTPDVMAATVGAWAKRAYLEGWIEADAEEEAKR